MLKHTVYSVLIVSDSQKYNEAIQHFLPITAFDPVVFAHSVSEAMRLVGERLFDLVIINAPLRDDIGIEFAGELSTTTNSAVLFSMSEDVLADIKSTLTHRGIFTLPRPASTKVIAQTIDNLCSARQRLKQFEHKVVSIEDKMTQIRHTNQAKLLLIEHEKMSESEAHHFIEREAMNSNVAKDVIALQIISRYATV